MTPPLPKRTTALTAWLIPLLFLSLSATASPTTPMEGFDDYVEQARQDWEIPGLAVAVIKDDAVVFEKGFGTRQLGKSKQIDTHTLFSIGSTTKAFTSVALALLVDEGKVNWDEPVISYLPYFRVADPYVTRELTVRDILTHRSGVETADYLWYAAKKPDEIIRRMRYAKQSSSLRTQWDYHNNMYIVAGAVIEAASGMSWEEFVSNRILKPLGMKETMMTAEDIEKRPNVAQAHDEINNTLQLIPYPHIKEAGPAGSIQSNVADMSRWMSFLLSNKDANNQPLLTPASHAELFKPQMALKGPLYPQAKQASPNFVAYGLSWFLQDYRGQRLVMHTGTIWGMSAMVALLPEKNVAVVVLANRYHAELRHALMYDVFDRYIGPTDKDWSKDLLSLQEDMKTKQAQSRQQQENSIKTTAPNPSQPLKDYTGVYLDKLYGELKVSMTSSALSLQLMGSERLIADMIHWNNDSFKVVFRDSRFNDRLIQFRLDVNGNINAAELSNSRKVIATFQRQTEASR